MECPGTLGAMHKAALAVVALLAAVGLSSCSQAKDAAKEQATDAACSLATSVVDETSAQAGQAIDEIGADPRSAQRELKGIRNALATAEKGLSGDVRKQIADARGAVDDLLGQARSAAEGADVDMQAVSRARGEFDDAIDGVRNLC